MKFGLTLATHGIVTRDDAGDAILHKLPPEEMDPIEDAVDAERDGFESVWLSDHVVTETFSVGAHSANSSGKRGYPVRPNLLDVPTTISAIAARTSTLRFSPSVHIAPYRHPLVTAHEFMTIDRLSGGRVTLAVGVGWEVGEFAALGVPFEHRGSITEESIQIYRRCWEDAEIEFQGKHFQIEGVSMDPKPVQSPGIPIWYGGMNPVAARRAARHCDALYPMFLDAHGDPAALDHLRVEVAAEADRIGRDLNGFRLAAFCTVRLCDETEIRHRFPARRPLLTGSAAQVLEDLELFGSFGYSHITFHVDAPSGTRAEWKEQIDRLAAEVLPEGSAIAPSPAF